MGKAEDDDDDHDHDDHDDDAPPFYLAMPPGNQLNHIPKGSLYFSSTNTWYNALYGRKRKTGYFSFFRRFAKKQGLDVYIYYGGIG